MKSKYNEATGFTIMELMITLLIVSILVAAGLPSFTHMIKNNRLTTQVNEFILSLNLTRSEAVKRGASVTITAVGSNWNDGWTVEDAAGNDLRIGDALQGTMTLLSNPSGTADTIITYRASGTAFGNNNASPGSFDLCDDRTGETGRRVSISVTGRISVDDLTCS